MYRARVASLLLLAGPLAGQDPYRPTIPIRAASKEARAAIAKFEVAEGFQVELWAAEPSLANPVAFCIDNLGRIYVTETFRLHRGVTDNRNHEDWIDDELACRTVEDRVAMYRRRFADSIAEWQKDQERIRLLQDTNDDGVADLDVVFAGCFDDLADGIGAGLLAHEGTVYYTCIPRLWRLRDTDGDGKADERRALHHGFGVHTALLGHDLHGLTLGIDGKLYFSIGDRGLHVRTREGTTLAYPDEGAVLRCNLDGTELEVVHRGLRNPQELAFDRFGNLFTGDNNSDGGDEARWVYVVEGGDSGWRIGFQSIPDRGPWNAEKLWRPHHDGQPAWIVPPIANFTNGPSGLAYDPGTGLPEHYRDCFLLCDFRGSSDASGIWALRCAPKGAGFELATTQRFVWKVLATDVDFGTDGNVYLTDWTEGWRQTGKGRIYRVTQPDIAFDGYVVESQSLLRNGFDRYPIAGLAEIIGHVDRRVRLGAQLALAKEGPKAIVPLQRLARKSPNRMARLHAIWALGIIGRKLPAALGAPLSLLGDIDEEVRTQSARVLGWAAHAPAAAKLIDALADRSSRVRFFAAVSLGQIGHPPAIGALLAMLRDDAGRDAYVRHAAVVGLAGTKDVSQLVEHAGDASPHARLGILLALRRLASAEIARFLADEDPALVAEACRAIHDVPIPDALPALAKLLDRPGTGDRSRVRRAINANFRLGTDECAARLARFAGDPDVAERWRVEALRALRDWTEPSPRDRVVNLWRPLPKRDGAAAGARLAEALPAILETAPDPVRVAAADLAAAFRVAGAGRGLAQLVADGDASDAARAAALRALHALDHEGAVSLARAATRGEGERRRVGLRVLAEREPESAVPLLEAAIRAGPVADRQAAIRVLAGVPGEPARAALGRCVGELAGGRLPRTLALEITGAAQKRDAPGLAAWNALRGGSVAGRFLECLEGGDAKRGEATFYNNVRTTCVRCHTTNGKGGLPGPDLKDVGERLSRTAILEALVDPSKRIAEGFGTCVVEMKDGEVYSGVVKKSDGRSVHLELEDGKVLVLDRAKTELVSEPTSSMPPVTGLLEKREIRDLVEFLVSLKPKRAAGK